MQTALTIYDYHERKKLELGYPNFQGELIVTVSGIDPGGGEMRICIDPEAIPETVEYLQKALAEYREAARGAD